MTRSSDESYDVPDSHRNLRATRSRRRAAAEEQAEREQVEAEQAEDTGESALGLDPDQQLPGEVFMVPNRHWGFDSATSDDHPGACTSECAADRCAVLVKGTDSDHLRSRAGYYVVASTPSNGLQKQTAFQLAPRFIKLHRIRTYYPERRLGHLEEADLLALQDEMARLHGRSDAP